LSSLRSLATFVLVGGVIIAGVGGAFYALTVSTQNTNTSVNTTTTQTTTNLPATSSTNSSESFSNSTNTASSCEFTETESSFNVSSFIFALTYDSRDNLLYGIGAINGASQPGLFSINPANDSYEIVANLSSGSSAIAYDPVINALFILDSSPNNWSVSVISGSNYALIENISLLFSPSSIFVDPANGQVFVSGAFAIAQILGNESLPKMISQAGIQGVAGDFAYNSQNGDVYVAAQNGSAGSIVYVINGSTQLVTSEISIPMPGFSLVTYDAANGEVYVASSGSTNITRIIETGNTYEVLTNISVPWDPMAIAYDPINLDVYAATNATRGAIYVIDSGTNTVDTPSSGDLITPQSFAFDPANGVLYLVSSGYPYPHGIYEISSTPRSLSCLVSAPPIFRVSFYDPYLVSNPSNDSFGFGFNFTSNQNALIFYNGTLGRLVRFSGNPLWDKMANGSWTPTNSSAISGSASYPVWNVSSSSLAIANVQLQIAANTTEQVLLNLRIGSGLAPGYYGLVIGTYVSFQSSYIEIYSGYIPIEVR
jgi:DNA-binding beta-propeller fold protein YncE